MEKIQISLLFLLWSLLPLSAQRIETLPFGDFEKWTERQVKESAVLGGEVKTIYSLGPYGKSPWASSNVWARVSGVTKTSVSVEPDNGPDGRCAKLSTVFASCRVAGLVDIQVLATGSLFWGKLFEPVTGVRNPYANMDWGIPFTSRPEALVVDYKAFLPATGKLVKGTTFRKTEFPGEDPCQILLVLQRRWEDADGKIHAQRVGTAVFRIPRSTDGWVRNFRIPVLYGDIREHSAFRSYMGLIGGEKTLYAVNSKGKRVPVLEEGWAKADTPCTHAVLHIASGCQGGFTGAPGNILWVDNLRMEYAR